MATLISSPPSITSSSWVRNQEIPKITSTVLPSVMPIAAPPILGGANANLKIKSKVSNSVVVGTKAATTTAALLPVVTPTGEPRGKVETADINTVAFTIPMPLTSATPTGSRGGNKLGAAISATAAAYCGKNHPILPTGDLDSKAKQNIAQSTRNKANAGAPNNKVRLNKFVRRLHDMLQSEKGTGIVEWRCGLLVLHSTGAFAKKILPKYFNTRNFKTFRRQLNYYGFVHVRSFSATGSTTTALWVNQDLAKRGTKDISSVLMLKRVEPSDSVRTAEGRRVRKEEAVSTVEDIGINTKTLQIEQIRSLALQRPEEDFGSGTLLPVGFLPPSVSLPPMVVHCHAPPAAVSYPAAPPLPHRHAESIPTTSTTARPPETDSTDDAANLLLLLSRSLVPS